MTATTRAAERARPDTFEMIIVHNAFRRGFAAMPGLVRRVPSGDTDRAAVVVAHIEEFAAGLHHHHTGEDELMWPLLLERAADDDAIDPALILRMEEQHGRIADLHHRVGEQAARFAATADPADGEALALTLTALHDALDEHMGEEERYVLPLVERVLTVEEWDALGERGRAGLSKDRLLVQLGYLMLGTTAAQRRAFLGGLPLAARIAWRLIGRRTFAAEYLRIYGEAPRT
jgi:hemerythrin-like domain-containing protein